MSEGTNGQKYFKAGARQAWESFKGDMTVTVRFEDIRDFGESVLALGEIKTIGHTTGLYFSGELAQLRHVSRRQGRALARLRKPC